MDVDDSPCPQREAATLDVLRRQIAAFLSAHTTCVLSATEPSGVQSVVVSYRHEGIVVECLLPRWSDMAFYLEQDPCVVLVVQDVTILGETLDPVQDGRDRATPVLRWLQIRGTARRVEQPNWTSLLLEGAPASTLPQELYLVVRVVPQRIDLLDESWGWGVRETLDLKGDKVC
jgi:hypothetical protein